MHRTLTTWQMYLLFLPGILGVIILELSQYGTDNYSRNFAIANLLWVFNMLLIVAVQAYFSISFDKATTNRIGIATINAAIPVAFFALYFLFVIYKVVISPLPATDTIGPVRSVKLGFTNYVIFGLIIYSAISFLFLNNWLVKKRILKNEDPITRKELANSYLIPMRRLVKAAVVVVLGTFLFWVIYDVVALTI